MKLADINIYLIGRSMFCMYIGKVLEFLTSLFMENSDLHSYSTRIANIYIRSAKLELNKTGIKYRCATIWNLIAMIKDERNGCGPINPAGFITAVAIRCYVFKVNTISTSCCTLHYVYMWNMILVFSQLDLITVSMRVKSSTGDISI